MQQNVALRVARKVELSSTFRNVARQVAACDMSITTCNAILLKGANQSASFARGRFQAGGRRKSCKQFPAGAFQVAKKIYFMRTCDPPSATCNVFQSSSLRCKMQEKLPRVAWPFETSAAKLIVVQCPHLLPTFSFGSRLLRRHVAYFIFERNTETLLWTRAPRRLWVRLSLFSPTQAQNTSWTGEQASELGRESLTTTTTTTTIIIIILFRQKKWN